MDILLIGEYSRLHNSLKEGLVALGHRVVICGPKDGFKDYPVDFPIEKKWDSGWRKKIKVGVHRLTGFDISSWLTYRQFLRYKSQLSGFDVVQLINENSFYCQPDFEQKILGYLFAHNQKVVLLSCGYDGYYVPYALAHREFKSPLWPYFEGKLAAKDFDSAFKFMADDFRQLHQFIHTNVAGVIASDLDYEPALLGREKYLGLIPNPINTHKMACAPLSVDQKIIIFHGINNENYLKKGNDIFEAALAVIADRYRDRVEIITVRSVPYAQYINAYDRAHIVLDQTYAMDQGYNALEAMAKGKVVFTGAEASFVQRYGIEEPVNVNAVPNAEAIAEQLAHLIENPNEITAMGSRARAFIEREHHYVAVAQQYVDVWTNA
ncbi:glycosyltransferase [Flavobacterium caeni]|uniref:Glycosyl transferases group 1 n=1 Tax=Flavobacterium caeni TaxID=490189 RepID=A0A1G5CIU5_9FLAO|nr:glycosyltransferase [Flavobacterium caeni]SCY02238.1 Glycosyl transferases group 1 [Flavobacterium caeni]